MTKERLIEQVQEALDTAADDQSDTSKASLVQFITTNFVRMANSPKTDVKSLLMLIAALNILNSADDGATLGAAKRLATAAFKSTSVKAKTPKL